MDAHLFYRMGVVNNFYNFSGCKIIPDKKYIGKKEKIEIFFYQRRYETLNLFVVMKYRFF